MRIAIFENLANNAYVQAKVLNRLGHPVDLVLDPLDRYAMSDPRWEDLDLELPPDELDDVRLPDCELPDWVRRRPDTVVWPQPEEGRLVHLAKLVREAPALRRALRLAMRDGGWRAARMAAERGWVVRTLSEYDCVIAYGMGPAWAALAGVPCLAQTWGGDITMVPFYDTGDWEGHEALT